MDIRQIVEETLIKPAREQAAQLRFQDNVKAIQFELDARERLIRDYQRKNADHERMVGKLYELLKAEDLDGAMDIVRDEFDAIHGPSD